MLEIYILNLLHFFPSLRKPARNLFPLIDPDGRPNLARLCQLDVRSENRWRQEQKARELYRRQWSSSTSSLWGKILKATHQVSTIYSSFFYPRPCKQLTFCLFRTMPILQSSKRLVRLRFTFAYLQNKITLFVVWSKGSQGLSVCRPWCEATMDLVLNAASIILHSLPGECKCSIGITFNVAAAECSPAGRLGLFS